MDTSIRECDGQVSARPGGSDYYRSSIPEFRVVGIANVTTPVMVSSSGVVLSDGSPGQKPNPSPIPSPFWVMS